jgi:flagellar motor switch protein FliN/FliY
LFVVEKARNSEAHAAIAGHIEEALSSSLSSMTGKEFSVALDTKTEPPDLEEAITWGQSFSLSAEPVLWLAAGKDFWSTVGQLTLAAVGIDSLTDEDCRSTWQEIVGQTMGAIASALTVDAQHEITTTNGEETESPADLAWNVFSARYDENSTWYIKVGWAKGLERAYDRKEAPDKISVTKDSTFSKTFELLLDVALPVSVSFGRTLLQIREVLKLNSGSIVELNRFVADPVDVVVNDCVIARGEVVVVDGNYGVRVTHLASKEDRLRSGMSPDAPAKMVGANR